MIIVANEVLRKYIAFEDGKWIHDPDMPETLEDDFEEFVKNYEKMRKQQSAND